MIEPAIDPSDPEHPVDPKRFVDLARGMGIPAHDAARQVMEIINDRGRSPAG